MQRGQGSSRQRTFAAVSCTAVQLRHSTSHAALLNCRCRCCCYTLADAALLPLLPSLSDAACCPCLPPLPLLPCRPLLPSLPASLPAPSLTLITSSVSADLSVLRSRKPKSLRMTGSLLGPSCFLGGKAGRGKVRAEAD